MVQYISQTRLLLESAQLTSQYALRVVSRPCLQLLTSSIERTEPEPVAGSIT